MASTEESTELDGPDSKKSKMSADKVKDQTNQIDCSSEEGRNAVNGSDREVVDTTGDAKQSSEHFVFSSKPTLEQIRELQSTFSQQRNWDQYHQPRNLLLALVGEVGEIAELFQWKNNVEDGLPGWSDNERQNVEDELSDVLIYLVRLAEKCHVDLPAAVLRKMKKNALRYPANKVYGSSKKYTEYKDS